jgi:hypothetical protein
MYSISRWGGRFGNNIQQISNAIFYCQENKLNFKSPPNDLINTFELNYGDYDCPSRIFYFHVNSVLGNGNSDFSVNLEKLRSSRRNICKNLIFDNLKIKFDNIKTLESDVVVFHIRSGDIFSRENYYCPVVSSYIQNPLSYYLEIIKDYNKIIVLTEDYENPVVGELSKISKVEIKICDVKESIELMLSSQNVVTSGISSFPIACCLLSQNIKKIYCSDIHLDEVLNIKEFHDDGVEVIIKNVDLNRYIKYDGWLNTD